MPTRSSGFLIESSHGTKGNFEVVTPRTGGGVSHLWRNNDVAGFPWSGPAIAFGSTGDVSAASLIQSNYGAAGNLEAVVREGNQLFHIWRDDGASWRWQGRTYLPGATAVSGVPGFIQSSFGTMGNFEVVAPLAGGGLAHWWRANDGGQTWYGPFPFGSGTVNAVALLQSNFGSPGNLEVVAQVGSQLVHYFRDASGWHGPTPFASGVSGAPGFIQSSFGTKGNFEVVAPLAAGGLGHWWRANDTDQAWHGPTVFGAGAAQAASLIQSDVCAPGNFEVVTRAGTQLRHYWRDTSGWHGPNTVALEKACRSAAGGQAALPYGSGTVAIHMGLMRTRKVVLWGMSDPDGAVVQSRVLNPVTGALATPVVPHHHPHLFCAGQAFQKNGELLVAGGSGDTLAALHTFDPATQTWVHRGSMHNGRWYPTVTALPDGRMVIISGTKGTGGPIGSGSPVNNTIEIYDPATGTVGPELPLPAPRFSTHFPAGFDTIDLYPFVYVLPSGKVAVHSRNTTRLWNPPATGTSGGSWDPAQYRTVSPISRSYPAEGTSVLLPLLPAGGYRPRLMVIGGAGADPGPGLNENTPAVATTEILDLGAPAPAWQNVAPMATPRVMPDAVLLPNGKVLVVSGSSTGKADLGGDPVFQVQWFDPATSGWTTLCSTRVPRLYHSTALLLPDGRVLIAGKDGAFQPPAYKYPEHRCELFSPPYLFAGPRPTFTGAPASAGYGASITVSTPDPAAIGSVALIRCGAVTHSFNMDQRFVGLAFTPGTGAITLTTPPNANVAPRGWYMLFLVSTTGVPSVASLLQLT
ncbi:MAG TPA: galactose oxidase-like domain-containing protein [Longimicrobium sp.]|nr:galactose oxidase-like domain-containing protein [Longimicrobium sp.]